MQTTFRGLLSYSSLLYSASFPPILANEISNCANSCCATQPVLDSVVEVNQCLRKTNSSAANSWSSCSKTAVPLACPTRTNFRPLPPAASDALFSVVSHSNEDDLVISESVTLSFARTMSNEIITYCISCNTIKAP